MTQLTITKCRDALLELPERLKRSHEMAVEVTRHGQPVLAVLPWEFYESLIETLDVLSDPQMVASLRDSIDDIEHGRLLSHAEVGHRLGLT
jgi:antitoxin YefM